MSVTLALELTEAIRESAERQGLSFDDWIAAAAELKFRADDEAVRAAAMRTPAVLFAKIVSSGNEISRGGVTEFGVERGLPAVAAARPGTWTEASGAEWH